ncbi:MAG: N-6 DNA methylase [Patescibacteria group bacterium]
MDKKRIMQNKTDLELDNDKLKKQLQGLVDDFKVDNGWQKSEEGIQTHFTIKLLELLGWVGSKNIQINESQEVKTGNKPDIILKSNSSKLLVIESKEASKKDKLDGAYQNKTFTEQLYGYCEGEGLYWGVLTNFVEWRLYSVAQKRLYKERKYAFHDLLWDNANKNSYIDLLSDDGLEFLRRLSKAELVAKNGKIDTDTVYYPQQLDLEQDKIKKEFFSKIKNWRAKLKGWISKNYASQYNVDEIDLMSQKILDRMIFMDICHDKGVINENHIQAVLSATKRTYYDELKEKFKLMDEKFNTELFAAHEIDNIKITNEVIAFIIRELNDIDFSKLSVHIIGEVYENYLGELAKSRTTDAKKINDKQKQKRKSQGIYYTPDYIVDYIVKNTVGELLKNLKTTAEIEKVKVLDPACGSGSFLIRAFDEFYNAYQRVSKEGGLFAFELRKKILQKNLFGVDLDAKAVEITKLNLMIKTLEGVKPEDLKGTHLLPNLNLNIRCGNSLIGGEKLQEKEQNLNLLENYKTETDKLAELKRSFYSEINDVRKKDLLAEIRKLEDVINRNLNKGLGKYFTNLDKVNPFNYTVAFCEIFKDGGFDAVIGNPPYINVENLANLDRIFLMTNYETAIKRFDIYISFMEKGLSILGNGGLLSYIIPYSFLNQNYAELLRKKIIENYNLKQIIDLYNIKVFGDAVVKNCIIVIGNTIKNERTIVKKIDNEIEASHMDTLPQKTFSQKMFGDLPKYMFRIDLDNSKLDLLTKIEEVSLNLGEICYVNWGARTGNIKKYVVNKSINQFCKKMINARNIDRYQLNFTNDYIVYKKEELYNPMFEELFESPKIIVRDISGRSRLKVTLDLEKYYAEHTVSLAVPYYFLKNVKRRGLEITTKQIELSSNYDLRYLVALINSKLINWYFISKLGGGLHVYPDDVKKLPIYVANKEQQNKLVKLIDEMLKLNKTIESREKNKTRIEAVDYEIDKVVYKLYNLTPEEINVVERR